LLLGASDTEIAITYSEFERSNALLKARHVADALIVLYKATKEQKPITWLGACERSIEKLFLTSSPAELLLIGILNCMKCLGFDFGVAN
jgi:hypothetical protein